MAYDPPTWADKRSYDEGYDDGGDTVVERIRAAVNVRCAKSIGMPRLCGLNKGHIGGCSPINATITITKERLEEILDG